MTLMKFTRANPSPNTPASSSCGGNALDPVSRFQAEIQRLLEDPFAGFVSRHAPVWSPALDLYEDKENLVVTLEVPGMKKEDFEIALQDGVLAISGERRFDAGPDSTGTTLRRERFEGPFQRAVTLPKPVSAAGVRAGYKDGILTVTLPLAAEAKPRQILVGAE